MPLNSTQKAQVQKYLKSKRHVDLCEVCEEIGNWDAKEIVTLPGYDRGSTPIWGLGLKYIAIECGNCGHLRLLSADRVGLV